MPLGQGIGEMVEAVQGRVELSGEDPRWEVTAGSFEGALAYARERFADPVVLARRDRNRWWPRVTIVVSTDPAAAASAPPLEELAGPAVPRQRARAAHAASTRTSERTEEPPATPETERLRRTEEPRAADEPRPADDDQMPSALAEIFDRQEQLERGRRDA